MIVSAREINWNRLERYRRKKVEALMYKLQLDAAFVNELDNVRYLVNFQPYFLDDWHCHGNAALLAKGSPEPIVLGAESSSELQFPKGSRRTPFNAWVAPAVVSDSWADVIIKLVRDTKLPENARIGVDCLTLSIYEKLHERLPRTRFVPVMKELLELRSVKSEEEVKALRQAAKIVDDAVETGFSILKPGVTERQVFGKMIQRTYELGSENTPWSPSLTGGARPRIGTFPNDEPLKEGDIVNADIGSTFWGYHGDIGRTIAIGKAPKEAKELYSLLMEVHKEGIKAAKAGAKVSDIHKKFRQVWKERGLSFGFGDVSGHGLGLRTFELPLVIQAGASKDLDVKLEPGMVLSLEPHTGKPNLGPIIVDDMVLVTESGGELLTKASLNEDLLT